MPWKEITLLGRSSSPDKMQNTSPGRNSIRLVRALKSYTLNQAKWEGLQLSERTLRRNDRGDLGRTQLPKKVWATQTVTPTYRVMQSPNSIKVDISTIVGVIGIKFKCLRWICLNLYPDVGLPKIYWGPMKAPPTEQTWYHRDVARIWQHLFCLNMVRANVTAICWSIMSLTILLENILYDGLHVIQKSAPVEGAPLVRVVSSKTTET